MDSFSPNINQNHGWLEVICGCMFSGKTEELIKLTKRAQFAQKKIQIFKPYLDNRYKLDFVVSHSNFKFPCEIIEDSSDILKLLKSETEFIAIDEVQFLDQNIVEVVSTLASAGKQVVCAGLDTDWQGKPFHPMPLLLASADVIRKQYAVCTDCGAPATRTQRTVHSDKSILVGSGEVYQARCRMHFDPFKCIDKTQESPEAIL
ncbi:MAG: thymidine kinase [Bdellovibrionales bacterium]